MSTYRVTPHNDGAPAKTVKGHSYLVDEDGYLEVARRLGGGKVATVATFSPGWSSIEVVKADDQELPK